MGLIVYCYFGYPLLLMFVSKFSEQKVAKKYIEPSISVVISLFNEEDVIEKKINNLLSLDYPKNKLEILIGSDGSNDRTVLIAQKLAEQNVQVFDFKERRGKMMTINDLVGRAKNEVIVFTDARQMFDTNALHELTANLSDPNVGCVSGELIFSEKDNPTAKGINLYWNYEKFLRFEESKIHSMLGATGAIYAIRRELYTPVPREVVLDDMFIPLKIIQKGFRAVIDGSAKAYDEVASSPKEEHRRKARTLYGNYQIFGLFPDLFNPFKSPVAIQLFSHKFLRVAAPFMMIAVFFINAFMLSEEFYKNIFILQIIFYVMALAGALARYSSYAILRPITKICYVPYVFCLLNFSALSGFLRFIFAKQEITWQKAREKK